MVIDPVHSQTLFVATDRGVYRSINGGINWTNLRSGDFEAVALDPANPLRVYAAGEGWVISADGGNTWASGARPCCDVFGIAVAKSAPQLVYLAVSGGVQKSTNGGASLFNANRGLSRVQVTSLFPDPHSPGVVYAGTLNSGILRSDSKGQSWHPRNTGLADPSSGVSCFALDPAMPSTLYAGLNVRPGAGIYKSTNAGALWMPSNAGLPSNPSVLSLAIPPSTPKILYVGLGTGGIYKSTNSADSWFAARSGLTSNIPIVSLAVDLNSPTTVYAGTQDQLSRTAAVFMITNGGSLWVSRTNGLPAMGKVSDILIVGFPGPAVYAATDARHCVHCGYLDADTGGRSRGHLVAAGFQQPLLPADPRLRLSGHEHSLIRLYSPISKQ